MIKLKCLERISTDSEIASQDLVEICKSNEKLRVLWLREVLGELGDIVPHCGNLEEIAFPMFASHKSYAALAELPEIRKVIIKTYRIAGCICGEGKRNQIGEFNSFLELELRGDQ